MLPTNRLDVSTTAQLGDALIALIKHDAQGEALQTVAHRRLELFVQRAEGVYRELLVQLAEQSRQQVQQDQQLANLDQSLHTLTARVILHEQQTTTVVAEIRSLIAQSRSAQQDLLSEIVTVVGVHHDAALQRITELEAQTPTAYWAHLLGWLRSLIPWRTK